MTCPSRADLRGNLSGHVVFPYTSSGTDVWDILKQSDRDPANPDNVLLVYSNISTGAAQEYNSGAGWTREHVWPQSLMRAHANSNDAPATDLHALRPAGMVCNSKRNNNVFGEVSEPADSSCKLACAGGVCEPHDEVKGQMARSLFYMAIRYDAVDDMLDGATNEWNNLILSDVTNNVATLLKWHHDFPVTPFERNRNQQIANYQGISNPFIDFDWLADCFGDFPEDRFPSPPASPPASPAPPLSSAACFVNEIHYDNAGSDVGERIEVACPSGISLFDWKIILYNGGTGKEYGSVTLSGTIPQQDGGFGVLSFSKSGLQNGPNDGIALVDAEGAVVDFVSYEGALTPIDGAAVGMQAFEIEESEGSSTPAGYSLQLSGVGMEPAHFKWAVAPQSFGGVNVRQRFGTPASTCISQTQVPAGKVPAGIVCECCISSPCEYLHNFPTLCERRRCCQSQDAPLEVCCNGL